LDASIDELVAAGRAPQPRVRRTGGPGPATTGRGDHRCPGRRRPACGRPGPGGCGV